jgi:hypothetical protein
MSDSIPKSAAELDAMAAPLYQAMGRAMGRWQYVETGMFILVHAIMGTDYKYSSAAFYILKGADMKLQLLTRLCESHFAEAVLKAEWTPLRKEIKAAIGFRNGLAHFEVNYMSNRQYLGPYDPPVVLSSHHLDAKASGGPTVSAANTSELNQAAAEWLTLSQRLLQFVGKHFALEALLATHLPHQWQQQLSSILKNSR